MKVFQNLMHRILGKSTTAARFAVKIRNQANCVIAHHLGESPDQNENGEFSLSKHLAPYVATFIDVGGNVGDWSDFMLEHCNGRGFIFEPSTQCVERLRLRFEHKNLVIRNVAVSDFVGTAQFAEEDNFGTGSSLIDSRVAGGASQKKVSVVTLDQEFPEPEFQIDFLKIDTEGFDLKVMKGAANLLSRTRFLQFEYNSHWISVGSSLAEAIRFLSAYGFSVYLVRSTGLHPLQYDFWGDYFRYSNYFACRIDDQECFKKLLRDAI